MVTALGYLGIAARDLAQWETFAVNVLGLQLQARGEDGSLHLRMDEHYQRIIVERGESDDLEYVGWQVASNTELDALAGRLRQAKIPYEPGSAADCEHKRVRGFIQLADPGGLRTEIFWGPFVDFPAPFQSPRAITGFATGANGLGHIVLAVTDFAKTMSFYRDVLGLRISDYIDFNRRGIPATLAFLHCNPRHHSLAFVELPPPEKRLSHMMIELQSVDDVGRTYALCEQEKIPIAIALGRHTNDLMFSFYITSPSGFSVEYGWGGRLIDDQVWQVETHKSASIWGHQRRG